MAGMNDFLTKPVSPERLSAMFRRLFGGAASADAPATGQDDRLGLQPDAEAPVDALLDGAGQRHHLGAVAPPRFTSTSAWRS
jgi:two-component system, sensor histidine kinase